MIAIVDYGIGNLRSAQKAFEAVGVEARLTGDRDVIATADGVVLPGVGNFGQCMGALVERDLDRACHDAIERGQPFLGICVGMQMLFATSDEAPGAVGLGIFDSNVALLPPDVVVPHMGWNQCTAIAPDSTMFSGLRDQPWMYFVHSYASPDVDEAWVAARVHHGVDVVAAVERANVWGAQFHPEKSSNLGLTLLANFASTCGLEPTDPSHADARSGRSEPGAYPSEPVSETIHD